jgi:hypothetical protein
VVLSVDGGAPQRRIDVGLEPYIERVFDNELVELDAAGTLAAAEANEHAVITAETRRLQIAAHWADLHPGEAIAQSRIRGAEHPVRLGGEGTPTVAEFAAAELGCALRMSDGAAGKLIGDALDLRHRLRLSGAAVLAGQVPAYQARSNSTSRPRSRAAFNRAFNSPSSPPSGTSPASICSKIWSSAPEAFSRSANSRWRARRSARSALSNLVIVAAVSFQLGGPLLTQKI